ncbi:hypothetical protein ETD86_10145 [Nonomuraea turkmeniaca]|uniref:Uncharacterized protein n=1 Tax=Nonomuraea turkmeniaca TaxID=103838 RepID=A0A5S4FQC6_9ACTN|nr:hypothetical protein [Nonomuraea turkmeniaca]TMR22916.1 hypothetical protein ETD86_10145 [Nonomuraea turkmeniaca]
MASASACVDVERGSRRARAVRISTVVAGVLQLAVAAVLAGIPGSSPTLDHVPVPEGYPKEPPPAALSARPATSPIPTPRPDPGRTTALPPSGAPADGREGTPPPDAVRGTPPAVRPASAGEAPPEVRATARPGKAATPVRTTPAETTRAETTPAGKGPATNPKTAIPKGGTAKTPKANGVDKTGTAETPTGRPSATPGGQTGEPPGQADVLGGTSAGKGAQSVQEPGVPPGQAEK